MCLAVPGQVVEWINRDPLLASATVKFGGISRICSMACVPNVDVGDYVIVHAGIAIAEIDEAVAQKSLKDLEQFGLDDELSEMKSEPPL